MSTNKIVLKTATEFMSGYTPIYQPIYPIFLENSQQYESEVGVLDFKSVKTVGDIRAKRVTPKDTEIKQIQVSDTKKSFKKYFNANQFQQSMLQSREGIEDVTAQVLDEHQTQYDEMFLDGDQGVNNGLYVSDDANYVLESAVTIVAGTERLNDLYSKMVSSIESVNLGGRKVIFIYGEKMISTYNGKFSGSDKPFASVLKEAFEGEDITVVKIPKEITPTSDNGWIVAVLPQVKMHYTKLPELLNQGFNDEKMYYWHNFMMGSCMLEVKAYGGITRQPATFA